MLVHNSQKFPSVLLRYNTIHACLLLPRAPELSSSSSQCRWIVRRAAGNIQCKNVKKRWDRHLLDTYWADGDPGGHDFPAGQSIVQ